MLYPSSKISSGYEPVVIATADGKVLTGILKSETGDAIEIEDVDAKRIKIAKADVDDRKKSDVSLMPNGLAEGLSKQDFADLIAYLETLKDGQAARDGGSVRPGGSDDRPCVTAFRLSGRWTSTTGAKGTSAISTSIGRDRCASGAARFVPSTACRSGPRGRGSQVSAVARWHPVPRCQRCGRDDPGDPTVRPLLTPTRSPDHAVIELKNMWLSFLRLAVKSRTVRPRRPVAIHRCRSRPKCVRENRDLRGSVD